MRAMVRRHVSVQPFKCGPDYIDTQYHKVATDSESINLDLFMGSEQHVRNLFASYSATSEVGVVEGAMGMFDGYDKALGSAAHVAETLKLPVILLINATATAYSVAATIYGFTHFHRDINVIGAVFNMVSSESHYSRLREACEEVGVKSFGYMLKNADLKTPSRHLGLALDSLTRIDQFIDMAADEVERHVDIDAILKLSAVDSVESFGNADNNVNDSRVVAVARDEAFNFIYPANIKAFNSKIVYFSPIHDTELPKADLVYLPGGYPELYADELTQNKAMRDAIKQYAESGNKLLAECGGLIYLTNDIDGKPMCGVLALSTTMNDAKLKLGYRRVKFDRMELQGHEFHYSRTIDNEHLSSVATQYNAKGDSVTTPLYRYKNVFAGYTHLYWAENDIFKLWDD
jgi:cobyrinic acid a,c-diamide synthase